MIHAILIYSQIQISKKTIFRNSNSINNSGRIRSHNSVIQLDEKIKRTKHTRTKWKDKIKLLYIYTLISRETKIMMDHLYYSKIILSFFVQPGYLHNSLGLFSENCPPSPLLEIITIFFLVRKIRKYDTGGLFIRESRYNSPDSVHI